MAMTRSTLRPDDPPAQTHAARSGAGRPRCARASRPSTPARRAMTAAWSIPRSLRWTMSGRTALDRGIAESRPWRRFAIVRPSSARRRPRSGMPGDRVQHRDPADREDQYRPSRRRVSATGPVGGHDERLDASRRQVGDEVQEAGARAVGGGGVHHVQDAQTTGRHRASLTGPANRRPQPRTAGREPKRRFRRTIRRHHRPRPWPVAPLKRPT